MEISIATIIGVVILWFWLGRSKDYSKKNDSKSTIQNYNNSDNTKVNNDLSEVEIHVSENNTDEKDDNSRGINNFYDLEKRILLMKELLSHTNKFNSEEIGNALLNIFIELFEKSHGLIGFKELNKAIECLNLIEDFEIDSVTKQELLSIKSDLKEMANISHKRENIVNKITDNQSDIDNQEILRNDTSSQTEELDDHLAATFSYTILHDQVTQVFENNIQKTLIKTKDSSPLIIGLAVQTAIGMTNEKLKEANLSDLTKKFSISRKELDSIIDEVEKEMLNKYIQ